MRKKFSKKVFAYLKVNRENNIKAGNKKNCLSCFIIKINFFNYIRLLKLSLSTTLIWLDSQHILISIRSWIKFGHNSTIQHWIECARRETYYMTFNKHQDHGEWQFHNSSVQQHFNFAAAAVHKIYFYF